MPFGGLKQIQGTLFATSNRAVTMAEVKRALVDKDLRLAHPFQAAMKRMTFHVVFAAGHIIQGCSVIHPVIQDVGELVGTELRLLQY
jgi:hypothetical protein